jgi:hypothetical protein
LAKLLDLFADTGIGLVVPAFLKRDIAEIATSGVMLLMNLFKPCD